MVTNGANRDGSPSLFNCEKAGLESARVGDRLSAEPKINSETLEHGFLEDRPDLRPQPLPVKAPDTWNPNDVSNVEFISPDGFPLDMKDVDRLLREQAGLIKDLTGRVRKLEAFAPKHCGFCKRHLEEPAYGGVRP